MAEFKLEIKNPLIPHKRIPGKFTTTDEQLNRVSKQQEINNRVALYGSIGVQLDKLWHDINDGRIVADTETANTWYQHVKQVKEAVPLSTFHPGGNTSPFTSSHNPTENS